MERNRKCDSRGFTVRLFYNGKGFYVNEEKERPINNGLRLSSKKTMRRRAIGAGTNDDVMSRNKT